MQSDPTLADAEGARQQSGRYRMMARDLDALTFRALAASESLAIVTVDLGLGISSWSPGAERLCGGTEREMVGQNCGLLFGEANDAIGTLADAVERGEAVEVEMALRHGDGSAFEGAVVAVPTRDEGGRVVGAVIVIRDVSRTKQLEQRLQEASHILTMGRLAAGIAHDVNNVLAIVQAYTQLVAAGELTPQQRADLRLAREAAVRGALLTQQLLGLGGRREVKPTVADLNELIELIEALLRGGVGPRIELATSLSPVPLRLRCQAGQLDQILLNLALNARDAMPNGGKITISTSRAEDEGAQLRAGKLRAGPHAVLAVSDTGHGMDARTLSRIFEPLYTTKPAGRGFGLGLSVVQETVRALGGAIEVESTVDQGSTFRVYLPLVEEPTAALNDAARESQAHSRRLPRVLVVDDNEELAASLVRLLSEEQLNAVRAKSGLHALQLLKDRPFDVIVTDQFMPGIEGVKLLELVAKKYPSVRRVLFTAYASPDVVLGAINEGRVSKVLLKNMPPVQIRDEILALAMDTVLQRGPAIAR